METKKERRVRLKRLVAMLMAVFTILTSAGISSLGGLTAEAVNYYTSYASGALITGSDIFNLFIQDPAFNDGKTVRAFCGKRGTELATLDRKVDASTEFSGSKLRILKAAWWFYAADKHDAYLSGLDKTVRYIMGRAMTWAAINGNASSADGVASYISNHVSSWYWNKYGTYVRNVLSRAFNGEFDGSKVQLWYYYKSSDPNSTWAQPFFYGQCRYDEKVEIHLTKTISGVGKNGNVKGAVYGIYSKRNASGTDVNKNSLVLKLDPTDASGKTSSGLTTSLKKTTTYYVKEITAPPGTELNPNIYSVTTGGENSKTAVNGSTGVVNNPTGYTITINKTDTVTLKAVPNAQFKIEEWNSSKKAWVAAAKTSVSTGSNTMTTGSNGKATAKLYYTKSNGGKFRITETKAAPGYSLPANPPSKTITVNATKDTSGTWSVGNTPLYGYIKALKKDDGATTGITSAIDRSVTFNVYKDSACKELVGTLQTNSSGESTALKVPCQVGGTTYYVKEVKSADGLQLNSKVIPVKVDPDKNKTGASAVVVEHTNNRWWFSLRIRKVDEVTGEPLTGATFTVYEWDRNRNQYKKMSAANITKNSKGETNEIVSGSDGWATSGKLFYTSDNGGKFMVKETGAPAHHDLSHDTWYVELNEDNAFTTVSRSSSWKDTPKPGKISLQKGLQDYTGKDMSSQADYSGIQYNIYDRNDKKVGTITLNASGYGVSGDLTPGTYYVTEVVSTLPDNMVVGVSGKSMRVTVVSDQTTAYSYTQTNNVTKDGTASGTTFKMNALINVIKSMEVNVLKTDEESEYLEGAEFSLYQWSNKTKTYVLVKGGLVSDAFGDIAYSTLYYTKDNGGRFKLVETKAPAGYKISEDSPYVFTFADAKKKADTTASVTTKYAPTFYKGPWNANTTYAKGDLAYLSVTDNDGIKRELLFQAVRSSTGKNPTQYPGYINGAYGYTVYWEPVRIFGLIVDWKPASAASKADPGYQSNVNHGDFQESRWTGEIGSWSRGMCYDITAKGRDWPNVASVDNQTLLRYLGGCPYADEDDASALPSDSHYEEAKKLSWLEPVTLHSKTVNVGNSQYYGSMYTFSHTFVDKPNNSSYGWELSIAKEDAETGELLPGAAFTATYTLNGTSTTKTFTDNGDGTYSLSGSFYNNGQMSSSITFSIKETKAPANYEASDPNKVIATVTLKPGGTSCYQTITATNTKKKGSIVGYKMDRDSNSPTPKGDATMAGAVFTLYADSACRKPIAKATTSLVGGRYEFRFTDLAFGTYYVKETQAPKGYQLNSTVYPATVSSEVTPVTITVTDPVYKAPIRIEKKSVTKGEDGAVLTSNSLAGAGFSLYLVSDLGSLTYGDVDGLLNYDFSRATPVGREYFTASDGTVTTDALPYGKYALVETTVPTNHAAGPESRRFVEIGESTDTQSFTFENERYTAPIKIVKVNAETNSPTTDHTGKAIGGTKFKIKNKATGKYLTQMEEVYDEASGSFITKEVDIVYTVDETGIIYSGKLEVGTYIVEEIEAAPGYVNTHATVEIVIASGSKDEKINEQGQPYYEAVFKNAPTTVEISKTDITTEKEITGAHLVITAADGSEIASWVTDGKPHTIKALPAGIYTLTETQAPDGYVIAESVEFTVTDKAGIQKAVMKDDYTKVEISKIDITDSAELPGAALQVWELANVVYYGEGETTLDENGEEIPMEGVIKSYDLKDSNPSTTAKDPYKQWVTTGEKTMIERIPAGEYLLRETAAPAGYVVSEDVFFTVNETGEIQSVEMVDDVTKIEITKTRVDTGEMLAGAVIQLLDPATRAVKYSFTSGEEAQMFYAVPAGQYILHEESAPAGFLKAADRTITVEGIADIQEYAVEDDTTKVRIRKLDEAGEPIDGAHLQVLYADGAKKGQVVIGKQFGQVLQEDGTMADIALDWTSDTQWDSDGVVFHAMEPGNYILHEVTPPVGYATAADVPFTVLEQAEEIEVRMVDPTTKVEISKKDITNSNELPGATLEIRDAKTGEVKDSWVSADKPHMTEKLPFGDYILKETNTPAGYVTAEEVPFTVTDTGEIQPVVMYDDVTKVSISKTDYKTDAPVVGAVLQVIDQDGTVVRTFTTGKDAEYWEKLPVGTYTLHEQVTPPGYLPAPDQTIVIEDTASIQSFNMQDVAASLIPTTGAFGMMGVLVAAVLLLIAGLAIFTCSKRKKNEA